ncbi:MAG TPA: aldehyde dehydrogenase family protein [Dehalococcoidales bacterium]|nr:aldehyde dehydrogenase family protein [Dehalococcoidales bacterium]
MSQKFQMWIGGKPVDAVSGKTYKVVNPATEEVFAEVPLGGKADVDLAVAAARKAFPIWSHKSQDERTRILNHLASLIPSYANELADLDIQDHGTPTRMAHGMQRSLGPQIEWSAQSARSLLGEQIETSRQNTLFYMRREPIGVCALIVPWNAPLAMVVLKMSQALAVGNTCVIKPPSIDSLTSIKFGEIISKSQLPPGAVNIITGPGDLVGNALTAHPGVDMISFTGSSEAGKAIMASASQTVKRLALELGGKNPFIVLEDANLDFTVPRAIMFSLANSGMICASPGRYYIHKKIHDEFVERLAAGFKKHVVGDPRDEKTMMGPLVSAEHRDRVEGYIQKGIAEGAKLVVGGKRPTEPPMNKGYYVMPTILTGVKQDSTIGREEVFGPVACFMEPFTSEADVLKLANDSPFGLGASVWTRNVPKAIRFAHEICAGAVWINDHMIIGHELPWGGFKESGFGKENGVAGLVEYTQLKQIGVDLTDIV